MASSESAADGLSDRCWAWVCVFATQDTQPPVGAAGAEPARGPICRSPGGDRSGQKWSVYESSLTEEALLIDDCNPAARRYITSARSVPSALAVTLPHLRRLVP